MATPVVTVASGGLPVVDVTGATPKLGLPVSETLAGRGTAVTKVASGGMAVTYSTVVDYPSSPAFSPITGLTGVIGWWDATVTASFTLAGSNITAWADQSGAGNNLSSGASQPTYSATGFNGRPGVVYSSASNNQGFSNASFALGTGNTLTLFGTYMLTSNSGGYCRITSYTANGASHDYNNNGSVTLQRDATTSNVLPTRNAITASVAFGYNIPHRVILTIKSDGTTTFYIDGIPTSLGTLNAAFVSPGYFGIGISQFDTVGSSNRFDGATGEVGIATGYSDATTVGKLDTYLKNKWGL